MFGGIGGFGRAPRTALPMHRWPQHAAPGTNQPYIADPATGNTLWLYERFHDKEYGRDYLVNRLTKERVWATAANAYLCPPAATPPVSTTAAAPARPPPAATAAAARPRELRPPPTLTLGADEVLLRDAASAHAYVFNRRTGRSRWLQGASPEPLPPPPRHGPDAYHPLAAETVRGAKAAPAAEAVPAAKAVQERAAAPPALRVGISPKEAATTVQRSFRGYAVRGEAGVVGRLRRLAGVMREVEEAVGAGAKHDLQLLAAVVRGRGSKEMTVNEADQRLLQVGEYLTQRMLIADGVDSAGDPAVRMKRKEAVRQILALIDQVESLRAKARAK
jgi:hypothetical protein